MPDLTPIVSDLLIVLTAGFLAGAICKRIGISLLVGYLVVGALIGNGALGIVTQENHELEALARAGALLLLFAVGIEFSLEELVRMSRYFLIGGAVQMILVAIPLTAICIAFGMSWSAAMLAGSAGALSSTVLVFKSLHEWGHSATPHGRRAIGILLFQDVALVPLMLMIPLLTQSGESPTMAALGLLIGKSLVFVLGVVIVRKLVDQWGVPMLTQLKSVELVVLFALSLLVGGCLLAFRLGLPPAIGALAAGMILSGNRLSRQIDSIVLPFRETFATIFFVTLGTLLDPMEFFNEPVLLTMGLIGMLVLKAAAAAIALRLIGLRWSAALGMGLGLAQLGEFSFLILAEAVGHGLIDHSDYNRMLFIAMGTLILTPQLLKLGLRWTDVTLEDELHKAANDQRPVQHAIVIGLGLIGRQISSQMEMMGVDVCLIDLSPINLHAFAQQGFHTVAGDARDPEVLRRAHVEQCRLVIVSVPDDEITPQIVRAIRDLDSKIEIYVRCRYHGSISKVKKAGATLVVSEEAEASAELLKLCEKTISRGDANEVEP